MEYTSFAGMPEKIRRLEPFRGNSIYGSNIDNHYLIQSQIYDQLIASIDRRSLGIPWYFDNTYYSKSVSRLQHIIVSTFGLHVYRYDRREFVILGARNHTPLMGSEFMMYRYRLHGPGTNILEPAEIAPDILPNPRSIEIFEF